MNHDPAPMPAGPQSQQVLEDLVAQLRTANENLVLATLRAQTMQEQAEDANRRQSEFLAMLAHELRNPLAPISNAAAMLQRLTDVDPRLPGIQRVLSHQIEHMAKLLDDLLDASRISSGKITLEKSVALFGDIIERALEVSQPFIDKRRQQLTLRLQPEPVQLDCDPVRLAQVFCNLLINASKFTQDGGHITLETELRGQRLIVTVSDNGMGIEPEMQPYIFDLFMQGAHSLARTEGGLGIGLTVARNLLDMHDGAIVARSDGAGCGSSFEVSLPVHDVRPMQARDDAPEVLAQHGCRILLIEDNVDANQTLHALLELFGHSVSSAFDGISGLHTALEGAYDVIVCDIGLPGMDGIELVRRLRERMQGVMPMMIAASGYGQEEDRARALEAGYDEYLIKPVQSDALLRLIGSRAPALQGAGGTA
jgi:two-component system, sensor histidine kinase